MINIAKTRVLRSSDRQIVTGIVVNDGLNVTRKYLRSLRAILHNIENEGIEAQLIKDGGLKDRRASRLELQPDGDGYLLGKHKLTKEEAVERFLQHLVGRFAFVGQVVNAQGQETQQVRYRRVVLYRRLLKRLHSCVRRATDGSVGEGPKRCERAILRLMKRYASYEQQSEWLRRARERRTSEVERWRETWEGKKVRAALERITTLPELRQFVEKQAQSDVRYWRLTCVNDFEDLKKQAEKYAQFPAPCPHKTRQVLQGFKETRDLGALTHQGPDATPARLLEILLERYEPHYYWLPNSLRKIIDSMSGALRDFVLQEGEGVALDLFGDPRLEPVTKNLKMGTRLFASGPEGDGTPFEKLLKDSFEEGLSRAEKKPLKSVPWKNHLKDPRQAIYSVIPALWSSLVDIFHSMYSHSEKGKLEVETSITKQGCFQIRISDPDSDGLEVSPGRDFAHGKLRRAAFELFTIAGYWIFARFEDGAMHRVDMLTGKTVRATDVRYPGFTHLIVLPNEKGFIGVPSVGDTATGSDLAGAQRRTVRVLIIDNNERRRNDNVLRWRALPDVELDAVEKIDRESYTSRALDLVLVHESNPESDWIAEDQEDRWPVVFFSGNNTVDCEVHEGHWYVSPAFLSVSFEKLVEKIVREGGRDCVGLS